MERSRRPEPLGRNDGRFRQRYGFLRSGNPTDSFYGADRKGKDLYANSVVALDAATGKLRWYYQLVHHDIFDYDVTGPPALIEVNKDGEQSRPSPRSRRWACYLSSTG